MGQMYRVWERMGEERRATVLSDAAKLLAKLDCGEVI
jgi:adenine-specific DNA glycosylase